MILTSVRGISAPQLQFNYWKYKMPNHDLDTEIQLSHNLKDQIMEKVQTEIEVGFTTTPYSAEEVAPLQKSIEQLTKGEVIDVAMDEDDNIHPLKNSILPAPYNLVAETKEGQRLYNTETKELLSVEDTTEVFEDFELGRIAELRQGQKRIRVNLDEESGLVHAKGSENEYTFGSQLIVPATAIAKYQEEGVIISQEDIARLKESADSPFHQLVGKQSVEQLDKTFETVAATHQQTGEPCTVGSENYPDVAATETEAADDESFALSAEGSFEAKVEIPGAEEAAQAGEKRIGLIGAGPAPSLAALTAAGTGFFGSQPTEQKTETPVPPTGNVLSKAEKKRQAAIQHNEQQRAKHNILVCKYRTNGLTVRLEILAMSNRAANMDKTRGMFAVYTINSATAASRINYLPWAQHRGESIVNQVTLDWLLDQIGETYAFEVRTGRIQPNTPRKFEITKTAEEWIAKGFYVKDGTVSFY